jgi:hypothetical protein
VPVRGGREVVEHHRDERRDGAAMMVRELDQRLRQVIVRDDHWRAHRDQRHHEIREAVRVREGNRAEIQIVRTDAHRRTDVRAVREEVRLRGHDPFRHAGGAGGQLDQPRIRGDARLTADAEVAVDRGHFVAVRIAVDQEDEQVELGRGEERGYELDGVRELDGDRVAGAHAGCGETLGNLFRARQQLFAGGDGVADQRGGLGSVADQGDKSLEHRTFEAE